MRRRFGYLPELPASEAAAAAAGGGCAASTAAAVLAERGCGTGMAAAAGSSGTSAEDCIIVSTSAIEDTELESSSAMLPVSARSSSGVGCGNTADRSSSTGIGQGPLSATATGGPDPSGASGGPSSTTVARSWSRLRLAMVPVCGMEPAISECSSPVVAIGSECRSPDVAMECTTGMSDTSPTEPTASPMRQAR